MGFGIEPGDSLQEGCPTMAVLPTPTGASRLNEAGVVLRKFRCESERPSGSARQRRFAPRPRIRGATEPRDPPPPQMVTVLFLVGQPPKKGLPTPKKIHKGGFPHSFMVGNPPYVFNLVSRFYGGLEPPIDNGFLMVLSTAAHLLKCGSPFPLTFLAL